MIAGGKMDDLFGIQYSIIQPVSIRELGSGLIIYKFRPFSYNKLDNAIIEVLFFLK